MEKELLLLSLFLLFRVVKAKKKSHSSKGFGEESFFIFRFCLSLSASQKRSIKMLRGALGLGGPGSPRRKGQQQQEEENRNNGSRGNGGAKLAAVLDAADGDDGALASPRGGAGGAAGEEDLAATAAGEERSKRKRKREGEREGSGDMRQRATDRSENKKKGAPRLSPS